jgi:hypothetical protein
VTEIGNTRRVKSLVTTRNVLEEIWDRMDALTAQLEESTTREAAVLVGRNMAEYARTVEGVARWLLENMLKAEKTKLALRRATKRSHDDEI